ncbi:cellulose biosynthesis protein BcsE [Burkholderia sp. lig30]|uniref:cellulose biosynthesis protein BcsE n=1 Tax=Burkholderia sp. lig30 TaxID=1192124 RepID=UPI000461F1B0|nr:cellulose biosynthesis protein BcsE [Burkholderia sp. lig30]KDB07277.1 cellulose biosynthesis protein BcsE [Burkholderia sp. lig30]
MNTDLEATRPALGAAGLFGRLRARLWAGAVDGRVSTLSRLAIDGLPDEWTQLESGGLYAIYAAARTPGCDALVWESTRQARTRDVTIVLARNEATVAAQLHERGFAGTAIAPGWPRNLNVLAMPVRGIALDPPGGGGHASRGPFTRLLGGLRALRHFGFRTRSLYFVEGAERWFSWDDSSALAEEGRALADWCRTHRIGVVLLMDPEAVRRDGASSDTETDDVPIVRGAHRAKRGGFHSVCAGVAQLQRTHGELLWVVDFWRVGDSLTAGEVRPLRFAPSGRLSAIFDADAAVQPRGMKLASDEDRVVVSRAVVEREEWVPNDWEIVADNAAVVAACAKAHAATAVLVFRSRAKLEALCAAVHTLRRQCGGALKIVVVERGEVLRHQFETLVLSLGANSVVGRDLPFSRLQTVMRSLYGQLHARQVATDYRAALAAALGDSVLGYLPVGAFCLRIRAVMDRGLVLALPHTLVKMPLLPDVAHVDALQHCMPRRAGDVVTADAENLYVFLFACDPADADEALKHIFDVPVERLSDRIVCLGNGSVDAELEALKAQNRRAPIADYSDLFAKADPDAGGGGAAAATDAPVGADAGAAPDAGASAGAAAGTGTGTGTGAGAGAGVAAAAGSDAHEAPQAPDAQPADTPPLAVRARPVRGATRSAMPTLTAEVQ